MESPELTPAPAAGSDFLTTHWSVVLLAGRADTPEAAQALNELCRTYWYPLFAFVRRSGQSPEDAADAVQGFFAQLIAGSRLATPDPSRGRFRSWLLTGMKYFLVNEWRARHAQKRGSGSEPVSFDAHDAEDRYRLEPPDLSSPEALYDRKWAQTMMSEAARRLDAEQRAAGQGARFDAIKECLYGGRGDLPLVEAAQRLGTTEAALKSIILRLRQRKICCSSRRRRRYSMANVMSVMSNSSAWILRAYPNGGSGCRAEWTSRFLGWVVGTVLFGTMAQLPMMAEPADAPLRARDVVPGSQPSIDSSTNRPTLVVLGDSLAAGYGVDPAEAYPAVLQRQIDSAGLKYRVVNAGVSGDTSAGALRRIDWLLRRSFDALLIEIGGNDGLRGQSPGALKTNLVSIIERTRRKQPNAHIVLAGMRMPPNMGAYAEQFERVFAEVAREQRTAFVPHLLEGVGGIPEMNQPDGIHPSVEGHRRVATNVWVVLEPALRAPPVKSP